MKQLEAFDVLGGEWRDGILVIPQFLPLDVVDRCMAFGDVMDDAGLLASPSPQRWECSTTSLFRHMGDEGDTIERHVKTVALRVHAGVSRLDHSVYSRMATGADHCLHADNATLEGKPNHTPWRLCSIGIYLTQHGIDHAGGLLIFPKQDRQIVPEAGMLVGFASDHEWAHRVTKVNAGIRQALLYWYR